LLLTPTSRTLANFFFSSSDVKLDALSSAFLFCSNLRSLSTQQYPTQLYRTCCGLEFLLCNSVVSIDGLTCLNASNVSVPLESFRCGQSICPCKAMRLYGNFGNRDAVNTTTMCLSMVNVSTSIDGECVDSGCPPGQRFYHSGSETQCPVYGIDKQYCANKISRAKANATWGWTCDEFVLYETGCEGTYSPPLQHLYFFFPEDFFFLSLLPRQNALWKTAQTVRQTFPYARVACRDISVTAIPQRGVPSPAPKTISGTLTQGFVKC
jgi:hypothetical protein